MPDPRFAAPVPACLFAEATVGSLLDAVAARYPDREALVLDDERLTFAEFQARAQLRQRALARLGIAPS